jgi:hypothetical protein
MANTLITATYLPSVPLDPTNSGNYVYSYGATTAVNYTLKATLESELNDALDTDINATTNGCVCTDPIYCVGP